MFQQIMKLSNVFKSILSSDCKINNDLKRRFHKAKESNENYVYYQPGINTLYLWTPLR